MAAQALAGTSAGKTSNAAGSLRFTVLALAGRADGRAAVFADPAHTLKDFAIICGLSTDGEPDDWLHLGVVAQAQEIWELQFYCCHKSGAPDATVIGSFVMFDNQGRYVGTTAGPIQNVVDSTTWTFYSYQYQFTTLRYIFPAIWWHGAGVLGSRYLCGVQMAAVESQGGLAVVLQPDIYLTLTPSGPKKLGSTQAHLGPPP